MKLPLSWLTHYVDFEDTIQGLSDQLTFSGVEVEAIEYVGPSAEQLEGIVVAEIKEIHPHPDADKLRLCTVDTGSESITVVCGAPNVRVGMKTTYAPVGVTLPTGLKLKRAKIRGVESLGMLCAEDELGMSSDHAGIMDLDAGLAVGTPISDVIGPPEVVFDLEITPNRPDCLSVIGIAREIAALYNTDLKIPSVEFAESDTDVNTEATVEIKDPDLCPRYTARVLKDVKIGPSPEWMQKLLTLADIRPINNAVDVTNFVMLECGQPLHAFDKGLLKQSHIIVRRADEGEVMHTLDDEERSFTQENLVIADAERAVAVAGVMGGADSEIRDNTETILLESAYFNPVSVRATAKQLNMNTDSSYRFARGADVGGVDWASRRATQLLVEHAGATAASGVIDVYPAPEPQRQITCRWKKVTALTGVDASSETIANVFRLLHLEVSNETELDCLVTIPTYRVDLEREVDLIEEFIRIHGLSTIPTPTPYTEIIPTANDDEIQGRRKLRQQLCGLGLQEAMHYSLTSEKLLDELDAAGKDRRIVLPLPMSVDKSIMRTTLAPQMIESLGRNKAYQNDAAALFEVGRVYRAGDPAERESLHLSIGLLGAVNKTTLSRGSAVPAEDMFASIKGIVEQLAKLQQVAFTFDAYEADVYEKGKAASILLDDKIVGHMGIVETSIRESRRLTDPIAVAELNVDAFLRISYEPNHMKAIAAFPSISRDAALVVDETIKHADIMAVIEKAAPYELEHVELFDVFRSERLGHGKKSMAYSFTYRSTKKTMTDKQATKYHEKVKDRLRDELNADVPRG
jgi:phenylalanyl-tRNA synthetase beta chain